MRLRATSGSSRVRISPMQSGSGSRPAMPGGCSKSGEHADRASRGKQMCGASLDEACLMTILSASTLQGADYFVLITYFVLMLGVGIYFYRQMRLMKDYFSGGNQIPWWLS